MFHNHSTFSQLDGINKIDEMIKRAISCGYPAIGLSDHGTSSGLFEFHKACRKAEIKPVLGVEFYFTPNVGIKDRSLHYHLCAFAKNKQGYHNLLKLVTESHRNFYYSPRIDYNILRSMDTSGLIFTTACIGGIMRDNMEIFNNLSSFLDLYAEVHTYEDERQVEYNKLVCKNVKPERIIFANDAHCSTKDDEYAQGQWMRLSTKGRYESAKNIYLMTFDEVRSNLSYLQDIDRIITNTINLSKEFEEYEIIPKGKSYPVFPVENQKEYLTSLCIPMAKNDDEIERLFYELEVLEKTDYINYILILQDIFEHCRKNNIRTGAGRGSVVGSLTAYLSGITKINPLDYGLVFERFAHTERISNPDIDTDVASSKRHLVIDYIRNKYKEVHQVRTFNYTGIKGAVQRAGEALGRPPAEVDKITKNLTDIEEVKDIELKELAKSFTGLIQNFGVHAAAIVIFPDEPHNYTALERVVDKDKNEIFVTAYDYYALEEMGLLKLDLLGVDVLDSIEETLTAIGDDNLREMVDEASLPDGDRRTFMMINNRATDGCFQIETEGMKSVIKKIRPNSIKDIVDLVALYRPGPKDSGMIDVYSTNKFCGNIKYLHPLLEPILAPTNGIILYQEQIQQICKSLCGYSFGQGDILRRIIGKKKVEEMKPALEKLINDGVSNGIEKEVMEQVANQIETFGLYGFNMGHSVAYGYTAYITAYLKAHYPLQFWFGVLRSASRDDTAKYIMCAKKDNVKILPPDIMNSDLNWKIHEGNLLMGFQSIKGIKNSFELYRTRDIDIFLDNNSQLNKKIMEGIIKAGCFEGDIDWLLQKMYKSKENLSGTKKNREMSFQEFCATYPIPSIDSGSAQLEVLGVAFEDVFAKYDKRIVDGTRVRIGICSLFKSKNDKNGKPMAFVSFTEPSGVNEYVMFWRGYKELTLGAAYIFSVTNEKIIQEVALAKTVDKK